AALKLLESIGISRSNYAPPLVRLLWRVGIDIPPPHFGGIFTNALLMGTFYGTAWGIIMWMAVWSHEGMSPIGALITSVCAGILFGFGMSGYYAYNRRKHNLPKWSEL
ncbi:DUF6404 family protein, partial [Undibacterium sp. Dicai25W]|uniref:DUF6404 family protein n=1 Tax=Undibacterium sp. Dicai25W TaxID=3413034 RepID=UPI003BF17632